MQFNGTKYTRILGKPSPPSNSELFHFPKLNLSVQFNSVAQSRLTLCNPMGCRTPGFPVHHQLRSLLKLMPSSHFILCYPLLPSIFLSIRVLFSESVLRIRWPKYWSFSFSICPSNEYSGLISFITVSWCCCC